MIRQDRKTKLPKSDAKTAYGLLSDIIRLSLAEPKRMRMGEWLSLPSDDKSCNYDYYQNERPACGTIGCVGGWAETLRPLGNGAHDILRLNEEQRQRIVL